MLKQTKLAAVALTALSTAAMSGYTTSQAQAQTIKVMVVQEDSDKTSLRRNTRIQNAIMNVWNQTLHAPAYRNILKRYGISGMDVYDETALTLDISYRQNRVRRRPQELIRLMQHLKNPTIDVGVLYTVYARAITDPFTKITKLRMALNYRALNVRDGRFLGGGNMDVDTAGIPFTGCAAGINGQRPDRHCVTEFVSENAERLTRSAANKLALQLAALLGQKYGSHGAYHKELSHDKGDDKGFDEGPGSDKAEGKGDGFLGKDEDEHKKYSHNKSYGRPSACDNVPTTFLITYDGFSQRQINFIEENMANWKCKLDLDTTSSEFSGVRFEYKTRSNQQRVMRNIRLMSEMMGVIPEVTTRNRNEIRVQALTLRQN